MFGMDEVTLNGSHCSIGTWMVTRATSVAHHTGLKLGVLAKAIYLPLQQPVC